MTGGTPSNIFDAAGGKEPAKEAAPEVEITIEDLNRRIQKIYQYHDEIEKGLDRIYQQSGFDPKQINLFLRNPQNLNEKQKKALEVRQEKLAKELVLKNNKKGQEKKKQKEPEEPNKRKGKTLGGRKGWISM